MKLFTFKVKFIDPHSLECQKEKVFDVKAPSKRKAQDKLFDKVAKYSAKYLNNNSPITECYII